MHIFPGVGKNRARTSHFRNISVFRKREQFFVLTFKIDKALTKTNKLSLNSFTINHFRFKQNRKKRTIITGQNNTTLFAVKMVILSQKFIFSLFQRKLQQIDFILLAKISIRFNFFHNFRD